MYSKETSSGTLRNLHKGKDQLDSIIRLSHSLSENDKSNYYDQEEEKLFRENNEIKVLIESLEKKK